MLLVSLAARGASSCASTGAKAGSDGAEPCRIALHEYRAKKSFELVNEAHTGRLEQYSKLSTNFDRKVQTNEIMADLLGWMESEGFRALAVSGAAPASAAGTDVAWCLEVELPSGTRHLTVQKGIAADTYAVCRTLKAGFLDIYNATFAGQATQTKEGESPFTAPSPKARTRP
jgi:hypothetical protein